MPLVDDGCADLHDAVQLQRFLNLEEFGVQGRGLLIMYVLLTRTQFFLLFLAALSVLGDLMAGFDFLLFHL